MTFAKAKEQGQPKNYLNNHLLLDLPCYWDYCRITMLIQDKNLDDGCQEYNINGEVKGLAWMLKNKGTCINMIKNVMHIYKLKKMVVRNNQINNLAQSKYSINVFEIFIKLILKKLVKVNLKIKLNLVFIMSLKVSDFQFNSNLSYLTCLNINTPNIFCKWEDKECKEVKNNQIFTLRSFSQVNCNTCCTINDGSHAICDTKNFKCQNSRLQKNILCDLPGTNRDACFHVKCQPCKWTDTIKRCLKQNEPLKQKKLNSQDSCKLFDINIQVCSQLYILNIYYFVCI